MLNTNNKNKPGVKSFNVTLEILFRAVWHPESLTTLETKIYEFPTLIRGGGGGYCHNYTGQIGMCRCEGYGFQAVYSRIG